MSWDQIPGWTDEHLLRIYDEAVAEAPQTGAVFVEVGAAFGRSTAYMARRIIDSGKDIAFYAVDPWPRDLSWFAPETRELVAQHGGFFSAFLHLMKTHAPEELERTRVVRATSKILMLDADFVFLDGEHSLEGVMSDLDEWQGSVTGGGVIAGHDHTDNHPGVAQAVQLAFGKDYEIVGTCWRKRF